VNIRSSAELTRRLINNNRRPKDVFFENYGETFSGRRGYVRDTVVAYLSDGVKQDELVKLSAAIPADLPVGSVVDSTGAIITTAADADYVVVEFAKAGATAIVVANPYHTILKNQV
jgi:hypothetical protein